MRAMIPRNVGRLLSYRRTALISAENNASKIFQCWSSSFGSSQTLAMQDVILKGHELLETTDLSSNTGMWMMAEDTLFQLSYMRTQQSVDLSILLFDKLIQNSQSMTDESFKVFLTNFDLVHSILYGWHELSKTEHSVVSAEKMYATLNQWSATVNVDYLSSRILSLLMEAATRKGKELHECKSLDQNEMTRLCEFTDSLFRKMIDRKATNHYMPPSVSNLNFCLINWSYLGNLDRAWKILNFAIDHDIAHDKVSYNILLKIYAEKGMGLDAERILDEMSLQDDEELQPDTLTYNTVLTAWANSSDKEVAAEHAQKLLDSMMSCGVRPDLRTFNAALKCWARAGHADTCEKILFEMHELYKNGTLDELPDSFSYTAVLNSFAKSGQPEKAELLCNEMCHAFLENGTLDLKPVLATFTCVMDAYSRSISIATSTKNSEEALRLTQKARRVFDRMEELYQFGLLPPHDTTSYNVMLLCYHRLSFVDTAPTVNRSAEYADRLLSQMKASQVRPDFRAYSIVIQVWLQRNDGMNRALQLLDEVWGQFKENKIPLKPDRLSVHTIIVGICRANRPDIAQRLLLEWCQIRRENPYKIEPPSAASFGSVLAGHARLNKPDRTQVSQELFEEMKKLRVDGVINDEPDYPILSVMNRLWSYSGRRNAHKKAYELLSSMREQAVTRTDLQPSVGEYNRVIQACSVQEPADPILAERVLTDLYKDYKAGKLPGKPLSCSKCFNGALTAWARGKSPDSLLRAKLLHQEMVRLHDSGELHCRDTVSDNILINAFATFNPTRENAEKAEELLRTWIRQSETEDESRRPDSSSYYPVIQAWSRLGDPARANALLLDMHRGFTAGNESLKPRERHFDTVLQAWEKFKGPERIEHANAVRSLKTSLYSGQVNQSKEVPQSC